MTGQLRISLLGDFKVGWAGQPPLQLTRAVRQLFSYLLLGRDRAHSRELIAEVFWGDYPTQKARGCLNTALWRLRKLLEPDGTPRGTYIVCSPAGEVAFNSESDHWLDVAVLDEGIRVSQQHSAADADRDVAEGLREALNVYSGELLEDCFGDWALRERERFRSAYLVGLSWLMKFHEARGEWDQSADCARNILVVDPLREEIHRHLIRVLIEAGRRPDALRQYEECRKLLEVELGVEPMPETRLLVDNARSFGRLPPKRAGSRGKLTLDEALAQLREAERELVAARENVERAVIDLGGGGRKRRSA